MNIYVYALYAYTCVGVYMHIYHMYLCRVTGPHIYIHMYICLRVSLSSTRAHTH